MISNYALGMFQDWLAKLAPAERMAIFGALQDRWCHSCGIEVNLCKCRGYRREMAKLTRSTPVQFVTSFIPKEPENLQVSESQAERPVDARAALLETLCNELDRSLARKKNKRLDAVASTSCKAT